MGPLASGSGGAVATVGTSDAGSALAFGDRADGVCGLTRCVVDWLLDAVALEDVCQPDRSHSADLDRARSRHVGADDVSRLLTNGPLNLGRP